MSERKFYEDFDSYYSNIPDCIGYSVDNYEKILQDIFALTNQLLVLNKFDGVMNGNDCKLNLTINNKEYFYEFSGAEYFHQDLLEGFNEIVEKEFPNENRRFFEIGDGVNFDFALVFAPREKEYQLAKAGIIWRSEDWFANFGEIDFYRASENYTGANDELPEYWLGAFSDNSAFKLIINTRDEHGKFEGLIYEGDDFQKMQSSHITCHGEVLNESISFEKYYDLSASAKTIREITGKEIRSSVDKKQVNYSGVRKGFECNGKYETVPYTLYFEGREKKYGSVQGEWKMKRVSYDTFRTVADDKETT